MQDRNTYIKKLELKLISTVSHESNLPSLKGGQSVRRSVENKIESLLK